jgi:hypothetical protein
MKRLLRLFRSLVGTLFAGHGAFQHVLKDRAEDHGIWHGDAQTSANSSLRSGISIIQEGGERQANVAVPLSRLNDSIYHANGDGDGLRNRNDLIANFNNALGGIGHSYLHLANRQSIARLYGTGEEES